MSFINSSTTFKSFLYVLFTSWGWTSPQNSYSKGDHLWQPLLLPELFLAPDQFLWQFCLFFLQHTWPIVTVMVLSLLCTHDDVLILWVRWPNALRSTVVLLVGASRTCGSVKLDSVWAFGRKQVPLFTGWSRWVCNLCSGTVVVQLPLVHFYWSAPREAMSSSDGFFMPHTVTLLLQLVMSHWQFPECTCWTGQSPQNV